MSRQDEMRYRSRSEPSFQLDYPVRLVASLAVQILGQNIKVAKEESLRDAAILACKLIDACHEGAERHYIEMHGLMPHKINESAVSYRKAVRKIVGDDRFKDRLADAIRDFETYFATQVDAFYDVSDESTVATDNPMSAAYGRMQDALTFYRERGILPSVVMELGEGYRDWKKRKTARSRSTAGAKGGAAKARKGRTKKSKTGKYKKKSS